MKKTMKAEQDKLMEVLRKNKKKLLGYNGVRDVSVGFIMKDKKFTDELGIVAYVHEKREEAALNNEDVLPKFVDGYKVDVIQSDPVPHNVNPHDRFDDLLGGVSISNSRLSGGGTLGVIVQDAQTGENLGLTNWHVIKNRRGRRGDNIVQPAWQANNSHYAIGKLKDWDKRLDCSVFAIDNRALDDIDLLGITGVVKDMAEPVFGMLVKKSGATTKVTYGKIVAVNEVEITIAPNPAKPANNNEISSAGDSGALWVTDDEANSAVALHWGGDPAGTPDTEMAFAKRITLVAEKLNFKF